MEERLGEAFAEAEQLTVLGRRLHPGEPAPDFCLHYLDLVDMVVHTVGLSDVAGQVRLLSVVNSLQRAVCRAVTQRWEALREALPPDVCIYTISIDPPEVQADFQDRTGVLHQAFSAQHSAQFVQPISEKFVRISRIMVIYRQFEMRGTTTYGTQSLLT